MIIKEATTKQFMEVATMAANFEQYSSFVKVDPEYTVKKYAPMIKTGDAVVFVIESPKGEIVGGLGGIKASDLHYPKMVAIETFWFVLPEFRGSGLKLVHEFEKWANENKCDEIAMIHLIDSHPEILERIYMRRGYSLVEKHYVKVLL